VPDPAQEPNDALARRRAEVEGHVRTGLDAVRGMARRGDYKRALGHASIMPAGTLNHLGDADPLYHRVLLSLAEFYDDLGEYVLADKTGRALLALLDGQGLAGRPMYASALTLLASVRRTAGDQAAAEDLAGRAVRLWRADLDTHDPAYVRCLQLSAGLHADRGDHAAADDLAREACEIAEGVFGEESGAFAAALGRRADLAWRAGRAADAEAWHRQALDIREAVLPAGHPQLADSRHALGLACDAAGRFADAEAHFREAAAVRKAALGEWHPAHGDALADLAAATAAQGRTQEALALFRDALAVDDRTIGQAFALGAERQKLEYMAARMARLHQYLSLVAAAGADTEEVRAAFAFVLRRKGLVAEAVAMQREAVLADRRPGHRDRLADLTQLRAALARRSYAGPGAGESDAEYRRALDDLTRDRDALEADLARDIPELDLARRAARADAAAVAALLPPAGRLVEFLRVERYDFAAAGDRRRPAVYLAFVLDPTGDVALVNLGAAEPISRLIADFRASITGEGSAGDDRDLGAPAEPSAPDAGAGQALRAAVFDPLAAALGGRTRLILAPDGDLARLPFEALPTADGNRLIDTHCVSYVGCGRDVLRFAVTAAGQSGDAVVVADPDFDLHGTGPSPEEPAGRRSRDLGAAAVSFARLPGTREEGESVAKSLKVRPWLQGDALERRLKAVRSPRVLHLSTHGFFLADQQDAPAETRGALGRFAGLHLENPLLRSGLALAGGNTWLQSGELPPEAEDGLLTAEDVTGMDLIDTELTVLSACDTGLGDIRAGEGVFGLRRAFALAGAKTLVMSLWKVPDAETRDLMTDFYRRILEDGETRAEALRNAQLKVKAAHPHPLFWGAFICQGHPGPLPPRRPWRYRCGKVDGGPVSDEELKDLIRTGILTAADEVSRDGGPWRPAARLKGAQWPAPG